MGRRHQVIKDQHLPHSSTLVPFAKGQGLSQLTEAKCHLINSISATRRPASCLNMTQQPQTCGVLREYSLWGMSINSWLDETVPDKTQTTHKKTSKVHSTFSHHEPWAKIGAFSHDDVLTRQEGYKSSLNMKEWVWKPQYFSSPPLSWTVQGRTLDCYLPKTGQVYGRMQPHASWLSGSIPSRW